MEKGGFWFLRPTLVKRNSSFDGLPRRKMRAEQKARQAERPGAFSPISYSVWSSQHAQAPCFGGMRCELPFSYNLLGILCTPQTLRSWHKEQRRQLQLRFPGFRDLEFSGEWLCLMTLAFSHRKSTELGAFGRKVGRSTQGERALVG